MGCWGERSAGPRPRSTFAYSWMVAFWCTGPRARRVCRLNPNRVTAPRPTSIGAVPSALPSRQPGGGRSASGVLVPCIEPISTSVEITCLDGLQFSATTRRDVFHNMFGISAHAGKETRRHCIEKVQPDEVQAGLVGHDPADVIRLVRPLGGSEDR